MTDGSGPVRYNVSELCRLLKVSRQGYYRYLESKERPDKHAELLAAIQAILDEDDPSQPCQTERSADKIAISERQVC